MKEGAKRKKLQKKEQDVSTLNKQKFYCVRCGTAYGQLQGNFSVSHSPMYHGMKYLPICRECVDGMFQTYARALGDERAAMKRMCMKLDLYWSHTIVEAVENSKNINSYVRTYISKCNMSRYIGKCYDDTMAEEESGRAAIAKTPPRQVPIKEELVKLEVPEELVQFWGPGYAPQVYFDLEERKKYFISRYPEDYEFSLGDEMLLRQISALELEINRDSAAGLPVDKNRALLASYIGSAQLKPTKKKKEDVDAELENMPLGVGIAKWETSRPLPPTPEELNDVSGMVKQIHTWVFGHLSKMVGLNNSHCKLYEEAMEDLRVNPEIEEDEDEDIVLTDFLTGNGGGNSESKQST